MPPLVFLVSLSLALPSAGRDHSGGDLPPQAELDVPGAELAIVDPNAQLALGQWYSEVDDVPGSTAAAAHWFSRAAAQGDPEAQYQLALLYHRGAGVPRDEELAIRWLELAAEQGHEE